MVPGPVVIGDHRMDAPEVGAVIPASGAPRTGVAPAPIAEDGRPVPPVRP